MSQSESSKLQQDAANSVLRNAAVDRCCAARLRSLQGSQRRQDNDWETLKRAARAYCNAMPDLIGRENISEFIACVAQGLLLKAIDPNVGPKLLYAAQVALSSLNQESKQK